MKLKRFASLTAVLLSATVLSVNANAALSVVTDGKDENLTSSSNLWQASLYDWYEDLSYGIELDEIAKLKVKIEALDPENFTGSIGGAVSTSCALAAPGPNSHSWAMKEFWGVYDEVIGISSMDDSKDIQFYGNGDYTFTAVVDIDETNYFYDDALYAGIAFQEWGSDESEIKIVSVEAFDINNNSIIKFNDKGVANLPAVEITESLSDRITPEGNEKTFNLSKTRGDAYFTLKSEL
ncbi:MAG: hypothetical protein J6B08_02460 [Ruminiclostridium sp.]|nr:hypothetical protein [Ruminiclostridium sp.]